MSWVQYSLDGAVLDEKYVIKSQNSIQLNYPCTSSSSCYPYIVTLIPGSYTVQVYGAAGGDGAGGIGGKGGFSTGSIEIYSQTTYYVYVGGKGASKTGSGTSVEGGFNGGGIGKVGSSSLKAGGGGGATDIRNGSKQLTARIIVAGGGGGGSGYEVGTTSEYGGDGGGVQGKSGGSDTSRYPGSGGTQISAGKNPSDSSCNGNLNVGGKAYSSYSSGGGGGGGYFGGAGGRYTGGGGGSGYIDGVTSKFVSRYTSYGTNQNNGYVIINNLIPPRTIQPTPMRTNEPTPTRTQICNVSCQMIYPFAFNFSYFFIIAFLTNHFNISTW
jgi:hypothetical protein